MGLAIRILSVENFVEKSGNGGVLLVGQGVEKWVEVGLVTWWVTIGIFCCVVSDMWRGKFKAILIFFGVNFQVSVQKDYPGW